MSNETIKATNIEVVIFTSSEYNADVQEFQDAVNSWLKSQPDNIVIEDIIYRHCGLTPGVRTSFLWQSSPGLYRVVKLRHSREVNERSFPLVDV